jgi:bifunctional non-homologous end joining protein LigD
MSLKEYERKRSFDKTPEPKPAPHPEPAPTGNFFCVQRHDATRLHYDFRLEVEGTLKSWAVPKGPSLEPLAKVLAVHVEDHPLDYGNFEGNIPKGEYGGGSVMLWDRGTYDLLGDAPALAQIERGDLKFRLHGQKLAGEFALVHMRNRGKGNEWLLIKKKDADAKPGWNVEDHARSVLTGRTQQEIAENLPAVATPPPATSQSLATLKGAAKSPMPRSIQPMLATLATKPPSGDEWLYEVKWDGVRAVCFVEDNQLRIYSRNQKRCDQQYPELSVLPHFLKASSAILDGEIAVLDENGRARFSLIQPRIGVGDPNSIAHLARSTPVTLMLFDLLYLDGYDLRGVALEERKRLLSEIVTPADHVRFSGHFTANGQAMLQAASELGLEGILAKRRTSKYEPRRSSDWIKIKVVTTGDFVIAGFTHGERDYFSSLVLGLYEGGKLVHVGQVGTGFNEKSLKDIYSRIQPLIVKKSPFAGGVKALRDVTFVRPELVAEIKYLEVTPDGLLRAPVFMGLRSDKNPEECVREEPDAPDPEIRTSLIQREPIVPPKSPVEMTVTVDGHRLKFTNLNKIFYPGEGIAKRDVINYYNAIADLILPHLRDRPLSLKRYPNGIDHDFFFQKDAQDKVPDWVRLEPIFSEHNRDKIHYIICNDRATLLYLGNLACIDQNPWMSRLGSLDNPDFALIDLDPTEGCPYDQIVEAAQLVKKTLDSLALAGYPKTTGGDGMHIYIPLEPIYTFEQVRTFAELLSMLVIRQNPPLFTTPRTVSQRKKAKVYFDYLQISSAKTIAAPYVLRAHPGAPVSTPLDWSEVKKGLDPAQFNIHNAADRFERVGDLFDQVLKNPQTIETALEKASRLV